jgi:hypothetical protein
MPHTGRWWIARHEPTDAAPATSTWALAEDTPRPGQAPPQVWPPTDPIALADETYVMTCWVLGCSESHIVEPVSREDFVLAALQSSLPEPGAAGAGAGASPADELRAYADALHAELTSTGVCPTCGSDDPESFHIRLGDPGWACTDPWHPAHHVDQSPKDEGEGSGSHGGGGSEGVSRGEGGRG